MGREIYHASRRMSNIRTADLALNCVAVVDPVDKKRDWFEGLVPERYANLDDLLSYTSGLDFVYCAVPHKLHREVYSKIADSRIPLLGEKPFGASREDNHFVLERINSAGIFARCSSQWLFYPGTHLVMEEAIQGALGKIRTVRIEFLQNLQPGPPPRHWKFTEQCGPYGTLTELGMHVLFPLTRLDLLSGLLDSDVHARNYYEDGFLVESCAMLDNPQRETNILVKVGCASAGHTNTWSIAIEGSERSIAYSTENMRYVICRTREGNGTSLIPMGIDSVYPTYSGRIFEFGWNDGLLQMLCSFCEELLGRKVKVPCMSPRESADCHRILDAIGKQTPPMRQHRENLE